MIKFKPKSRADCMATRIARYSEPKSLRQRFQEVDLAPFEPIDLAADFTLRMRWNASDIDNRV